MSQSEITGSSSETEEKYVKLTHREHILQRPDSYIGSVDTHEAKMWVCTEDGKFEKRNIKYVPGLYKIFDEILVNAADNKQRSPPAKTIKVVVNPDKNMISVWNDGQGIPLEKQYDHIDKKEYYTPQFIFSQLLTSSNYDDKKEKVTGGRNGYGAKLTNIYSTKFILDLVNNNQSYHQEFSDNMTIIGEPVIKAKKEKSSTKVTFYPDLKRFGLEKLDKDHVDLIRRRVYDLALTAQKRSGAVNDVSDNTTKTGGTTLRIFAKTTQPHLLLKRIRMESIQTWH